MDVIETIWKKTKDLMVLTKVFFLTRWFFLIQVEVFENQKCHTLQLNKNIQKKVGVSVYPFREDIIMTTKLRDFYLIKLKTFLSL